MLNLPWLSCSSSIGVLCYQSSVRGAGAGDTGYGETSGGPQREGEIRSNVKLEEYVMHCQNPFCSADDEINSVSGQGPLHHLKTCEISINFFVSLLRFQFDAIENKPIVALYGGGAVLTLWLANAVVGAVDALPLVRKEAMQSEVHSRCVSIFFARMYASV